VLPNPAKTDKRRGIDRSSRSSKFAVWRFYHGISNPEQLIQNSTFKRKATMIKFAYTILYVQDVEKSVDFYEKAFGFARKFVTPENDYGELLVGDTTLSFASIPLANSNLKEGFTASSLRDKPFGIEIGFTTDNVAATVKTAVSAGGTILEEPKTKSWGQVVAYIRDLDGFLIEICTPIGE
jgi:lactoylglutathione lyase